MPVNNRIAAFADDMAEWRRWLHAHPELSFDCHGTAAYVAERLRDFGVDEIHEEIGRTGIVALIHGADGGTGGPVIGLRADMDALPITEATGKPWASLTPGKMHACGHDGHTAMLLGAARYMAETRNFSGTVALIFQPAEENGGGGKAMVDDGMMDRFGIGQVYALHNAPGRPVGEFSTRAGPIMAAVDEFRITVTGRGGHAARPHSTVDPIPAVAALVQSLQTLVSRETDPVEPLVISVTQIHVGTASNIIASEAFVGGTVRSFSADLRDRTEARIGAVAAGIAAAHGVEIALDYERSYPATVNHEAEVAFAAEVAREVAGADAVDVDAPRVMGAEDFSYMLEARPGAYLKLGQGDTAGVHHPAYDFDDAIAPVGATFFARLVETAQPLRVEGRP